MTSRVAGPLFDPEIRDHIPPDPSHKELVPPRDRAFFADPEKKQLLSACTKVEYLTESIGTHLHGIQLSKLNDAQKDELALLVAEVLLLHLSLFLVPCCLIAVLTLS
jgi:sulfonate dioxygenase